MKQEDSNPLEPVGDAPLEARILAWVLGDASAFEGAELERLCEERPELAVYRRRMELLHGMLGDASGTNADEEWKLSPDRRAKIEALFGTVAVAPEPEIVALKPKKRSWQPWARQMLMTAAACLVLALGFRYVFTSTSNSAKLVEHANPEVEFMLKKDAGTVTTPISSPPPLAAGRTTAKGTGAGFGYSQLEMPQTEGSLAAAPPLQEPGLLGGLAGDGRGPNFGSSDRGKEVQSRSESAPASRPAPHAAMRLTDGKKADDARRLGAKGAAEEPLGTPTPPPTVAAAPAKPSSMEEGRLTGALRSGDGTITRGNIDAALNNRDGADAFFGGMVADSEPEALAKRKDGIALNKPMPSEPREFEGFMNYGSPINGPQPAADALANDASGPKRSKPAATAPADPATPPARPAGGKQEPAFADLEGMGKLFDGKNEDARPLGLIYGALEEGAVLGKYSDVSPDDQLAASGKPVPPPTNSARSRDRFKPIEGEKQGESQPELAERGSFFDRDGKAEAVDAPQQPPAEATPAAGERSLAQREMNRRQDSVAEANKWMSTAREAKEKGDAASALQANQKALDMLPEAPVVEEMRKALKDEIAKNRSSAAEHGAAFVEPEKDYREAVAVLKELKGKMVEKQEGLRLAGSPQDVAQLEQMEKVVQDQEDVVEEKLKLLDAVKRARKIQPKPAPPLPTDEIPATEDPFSTFSLHVSDASFKVAKAALDRGERPSPEQIRPEEFYNAFDYGDPAPAAGEAVAANIEQARHPVLPQRNLVRVSMRVGSSGRGAGQPLNLTVLLDNSGSMEREDRNAGLKAAISQLASLLGPNDTVTLAAFSRTPHLLADRLSGADAAKLVELVDKLPSQGGTNLEEALKLAGELAIQRKNPAAQNRIVLLTDGAANLGNAKPDDLAEKVAALRQQGIAFDAAGIAAGGLNDRMLEALTRNGNGRYYIVNDAADADANFARQLAGAFRPAASNVKVQVRFNPDRVSRYKLIGFEKHRLKTEDFRNDAVDAAELAAEEAGVALYQVELKPDGGGEIGEVSVRFRDESNGQMVERPWTIPYEEKTPAFDQARPSMQLAVLAALAAEKLRGGPLAGAIDFTKLANETAKVRNYYGSGSRAAELADMIGRLK